MGGMPTRSAKRSANTERDNPTSFARVSIVQPRCGLACNPRDDPEGRHHDSVEDPVAATAILDRLLHHATTLNILHATAEGTPRDGRRDSTRHDVTFPRDEDPGRRNAVLTHPIPARLRTARYPTTP